MRLEKLDIKGFKSFGDKISIHFNEGVTAIVGPNGCGKSNVVDAIRWVLGEQSTRMLRSEKMENIIFNGTKNRKPANLAEVSLTFDNTKNILPTAFSKVTITRKLYRTGESEYRLNDVQCRLKDITDLFLDTGIGADSYSIIELKMIDEIIANKEGSRRNLFEEASGISKYKIRKKQTLSRLKDTETDLSRVDDLLFEIEKNLKTLENQAKKAERYFKLKEKYKILSLILASFKIVDLREHLLKLEAEEENHTLNKTKFTTKIDQAEAKLQQQKLESLIKEKNLSTQQKATNEFLSKIRTYESEKKIKNEQLKFLQEKEKRISEDLEKDKNQLLHVQYNIKRLNEEKLEQEQVLNKIETDLNILKQIVDDLRLQQQTLKIKIDSLQNVGNNLQNTLYLSEKEIDILNIQQEALLQESNRNFTDTENKELELNQFNDAIGVLENSLFLKNTKINQLKIDDSTVKSQIEDFEEIIISDKELLNNTVRKLDAKQNEYQLTKSMVDNLEGFPESIRFLKKNAQWNKNAPLLSDILYCQEEYRIAIEGYLEPLMNYYVVQTYQDALEAINLLSSSARGKANFFILDLIKISTQKLDKTIPNGLSALEVTEVDEKYLNLSKYLLDNVYLIDLEYFSTNNNYHEDLIFIEKSGKICKSKFTLSGGSVGLFEGKRIGRVKNLDNLTKEIKSLEQQTNRLKTEIEEKNLKIKSLKEATKAVEIADLTKEINLIENQLISIKTKQEQYQSFIKNTQNRKKDIEDKLLQINSALLELSPKIKELRLQKIDIEVTYQKELSIFSDLSDLLNTKSSEFNAENLRYYQQKNKISSTDKDIEYRESLIDNLTDRVTKYSTELEITKANILETVQHVDYDDEDLLSMYQQKEEMEVALQESEKDYDQSKESIAELETNLISLRKHKNESDLVSDNLKDKKTNLKIELNSLKERLAIEFEIDIADILDDEPPKDENETEVAENAVKIKKQLDDFGAINPMAMEAYQEIEERYNFIINQKTDLLNAKASLLDTIKEIDDTAQEKFMQAFVMVRENFMKVFRSLFNQEDNCDLILTTPSNPLESDIDIIARPKGKRPLSINQLSGGEKTLTATALLFSLYLLKPAPFCIFDEVDAPLDDTNIDKFNNIIRTFSNQSQFIVVSHNKKTIASTDIIYGVTMVEQGVSKVVAVDLREVA